MTQEGFHSARSTRVSEATVCKIRLHYRGPRTPNNSRRYAHGEPGYLSVRDLAERLSCDIHWIYRQIEAGRIDAAYLKRCPPRNAYFIQDHPELLASLHEAKKQAEEFGQQRLAKKMRKQLPSFSEAMIDGKPNTSN
jgi:hypothetical protein